MNGRHALAVLAALLTVGGGAAWLRMDQAPAAIPPAGMRIAPPPIPSSADLTDRLIPDPPGDPADDLADALARPLFAPGRRPPRPVALPPAAVAGRAGPPVPVAIITGGEAPLALLRLPGTARLLRLRLGESTDGWQLRGIEPGALLMQDEAGALHVVPLRRPRVGEAGTEAARQSAGQAGARNRADPIDDITMPEGDEENSGARPNAR